MSFQKDRYKEISEEYHKIEIRKQEERIEEEVNNKYIYKINIYIAINKYILVYLIYV